MEVWKIEIIDPNEKILINWDSTQHIDSHMHEFIEIEYVLSGKGVQIINGVEYEVQKGDVLFLNIGDTHSYNSKKELKVLNCIFYPELFNEKKKMLESEIGKINHLLPNFKRLSPGYIFEVESIMAKIQEEFFQKEFGYNVILQSYITALLVILVRATDIKYEKDNSNISNILDYMENNFINVSLNEIASYFNYSSTYFSKYFKNNLGISFSKYVNNRRIFEAIKLLNETNDTIESICAKIGYKDTKQFYKIFKDYVGMTPNLFRKSVKYSDKK